MDARWTIALAMLALIGIAVTPWPAAPLQPLPAPSPTASSATAPAAMPTAAAAPPASPRPQRERLFAPGPPPKVHRFPHRPRRCVSGPPAGRWTFEVADAVRRGACAEALVSAWQAMDVSPDHCRLYAEVWRCFTDTAEDLGAARAATFDEFALLLPAFEGERAERAALVDVAPGLAQVPQALHPAVGGIEFALEAWADEPALREAVVDIVGPGVGDDLARMLELEGVAATGLARAGATDRRPELVEAWARRVYVLARALAGPVQRRIEARQVELLREQLERATADGIGPDGATVPPPDLVLEALRAGAGGLSW